MARDYGMARVLSEAKNLYDTSAQGKSIRHGLTWSIHSAHSKYYASLFPCNEFYRHRGRTQDCIYICWSLGPKLIAAL